ncbi:hypothetical protein POVCU1_009220 [Plasmodium ovale curtisi]|uniref:Uncharacterized protein n=1 Tax=Plasmodium ovale curtisi TaxID=864141 RepID=A0A1A8VVM6_PLAOA|nr:hypothetical protein POVCU1_009220 [Plasmodium ovale curtisi]
MLASYAKKNFSPSRMAVICKKNKCAEYCKFGPIEFRDWRETARSVGMHSQLQSKSQLQSQRPPIRSLQSSAIYNHTLSQVTALSPLPSSCHVKITR